MLTFARVDEARQYAWQVRHAGHRLGLVPTMGYLHEGHLGLVRALRPLVDRVVMSIFVNPTQFAPGEDLDTYPHDLVRDLTLAREAGVDGVFQPPAEEMYPLAPRAFAEVEELGRMLEGSTRPTHFRGVATVVLKLLHVFSPDVVAFGQKDAQQLVLVRRLVHELLLPVQVLAVQTVREPDGLARSSRNVYLDQEDRQAALVLSSALREAEERIRDGERRASAVRNLIEARIAVERRARLDYAAVVCATDLMPLVRLQGRVLLLCAARFGPARLIDNVCLDVEGAEVREALP